MGNLPHPLTRFFGREEEIAALTSLLQGDGTRLLTLTGPGGSGKSRLALEVAWRLAPAWCGRVWQVSLVDLGEAGQIEEAIRDAMGLSRSTRGEPHEQVVAALAGRPTLLLLDNFEHLIGAGTCRLEALLERATGLTALVTSRRRLGLAGEREVPVRPLPIGPAVSLFLDRAAAADPDFAAGPDTPGDVTALCEGLERIPLAIELAAARAAVLTPAQMLAHLSPRSGVGAGRREPSTDHSASTRRGIAPSSKLQAPGSLGQGRPREPGAWSLELGARSSERFQLLVSHRRHDPARHRSLRATLEWSYRLLSPELQRFFARLSVFRGGWTEEAAAAICDTPLARSFLEQLRDASMLQAEEIAGETRYRMLETLREFADEQLSPTEALDVGQRHGRYYLQRAVASEWLLGLEAEIQNLLAALTYFVTVGDADSGLEMAWELFYYWEDQWQVAEGRRHLARLLALAPHRRNQARAHGLQAAGMLASLQGDLESAWQLLTEALALNRELGLERGISGVLACLGRVARDRGDFVRARSLAEESLKTAHRCGDSKLTRHPLFDLAMLEWLQGNAGTARTLLLQRLEIDRALGDADLMADTLSALGNVALQSGDAEEAGRYFEESLAHYRSRGHRPALGWALLGLAAAARAHGDAASAETLCEESVSIRREIGDRRGLAASLQMLGALARDRGDRNSAREFLRESLDIHRALRDQLGIVTCIEEVGALARDAGRPAIATRLFAAASVRRDLLPAPLPPRDQAAREACLMTLHASLGEAAFSEAWEAGSQLAGEQIADVALTDLAALPDTTTRGSALLELTDDRWERVRALLSVPSCNGRPRRDDRHVLDGILYVLGTGSRWRDLPRHYGSPATCWRRLRQWQADGTWQRICELLSLTEVEADALGSVRFGKRPGQRIGERRADNPRTKADDASSPPRTRAR